MKSTFVSHQDSSLLAPPGSERASELLAEIAACRSRVVRFCMQRLRDRADAEDATQDVMLRAIRAARAFRGDATTSTWLLAIAARVCVRAVVRRNRRTHFEATLEIVDVAGSRQRSHDPWIARRLARLSADDRDILRRRFWADQQLAAIAHDLEIGNSAAKMRMQRACHRYAATLFGDSDVEQSARAAV